MFRKSGFVSVQNNCKIRCEQWGHYSSRRMRLEAATVWFVGLVGTPLGQVRWGGQEQAGQGGGFNPDDESPALGQPSSNPGVACRNETTGVFGPCTGKHLGNGKTYIKATTSQAQIEGQN